MKGRMINMPLENSYDVNFPPPSWRKYFDLYAEHSAWYSGDPNQLASVFSQLVYTPTPKGRFWSKQLFEERRTMLHVPMAGDLSGTSADLLFSEPPKIKIPEAFDTNPLSDAKDAQKRIEEIADDGGLYNKLLESAETCSALGGVFIKPNWDTELSEVPVLSIAQADNALPFFKFGFLSSVMFWKTIEEDDNGVVWRFCEMHEPGVIYNGLYKGDSRQIGLRVGMDVHPATAGIQEVIETQIPGLLVRYVPNMQPNRRFRGTSLGQSDYSGSEGLMDALDEVYSSWMRDIRLGQARIMVPEYFLQRQSDGNKSFDVDKEVYTTFNIDPLTAQGMGITTSQFEIRTEQHKTTALELIDRIITNAGYSPSTFGLNIEGRAESGTALNIRERKTFLTKSKKERYWKSAIQDILYLMMLIDNIHLGNKSTPTEYYPLVEFQDSMYNDITQTSQTVSLLNTATAASIETKVRMIHPDWDMDQVNQEVAKIKEENGMNMADPSLFKPDITTEDKDQTNEENKESEESSSDSKTKQKETNDDQQDVSE
jgi:A118 family predicted phage portal protein